MRVNSPTVQVVNDKTISTDLSAGQATLFLLQIQ